MKTHSTLPQKILTAFIASVALLGATISQAAPRTASVSGLWSSTVTWGGSAIPTSSDDVTINASIFVTNTAAAVCNNLSVNGTLQTSQALTVSGSTTINGVYTNATGQTKAFTGDVTVNSGGVWSEVNGTGAALTFAGNLSNGGTFIGSTDGLHTFSGANKTFGGSAAISIPKVSVSGTYTVASGTTLSLGSANPPLTIAGGVTNLGTVILRAPSGNNLLTGVGAFVNGATGTLNIATPGGQGATITTLDCTAVGNTVISGLGVLPKNAALTYHNLILTNGVSFNLNNHLSVNGTLTLKTAPVGLNSKTITFGNGALIVRTAGSFTGTGTFAYGATGINVTYDDTSAAISGAELPTVASGKLVDLTISNPAGVTLGANAAVNGTLTLTSGALSIGANTLTLNGSLSVGSGSLTGGATSAITCSGGSSLTLPGVDSGLQNLTINNSSGVLLGSALSLGGSGTLTLTTGTLSSAGNLTMGSGTSIIVTAGALSGTPTFSGTVNLTYNNTSSTTTGSELPTGSTALDNLTINNAAGVVLNAAATVNGTLTLTTGTLSSANNLTLASGKTIVRTAGSLSGTPTFSGTVNVTYNGVASTTTGEELPTSGSALDNLTITDLAGVVLNAAATVNGTLAATYADGTPVLNAGANALTFNTSPVNITVSGASLGVGDHTIVSGSAVAGTLGTVTVTGSGAPYSPAPTASVATGALVLNLASGIPTPEPLVVDNQGGTNLVFSWTQSGWKLQSQTNALDAGLGSNWVDYPGGTASPVNAPVSPANPTVFFRLKSQSP